MSQWKNTQAATKRTPGPVMPEKTTGNKQDMRPVDKPIIPGPGQMAKSNGNEDSQRGNKGGNPSMGQIWNKGGVSSPVTDKKNEKQNRK